MLCSLLAMGQKRIIFCSRTHKQLNNILDDFNLTTYTKDFSIAILGSPNVFESNYNCNHKNLNEEI